MKNITELPTEKTETMALLDSHPPLVQIKIAQILSPLLDALRTDGAHHKQWFIEETLRNFGIDPDKFEHERGIAP